MAISDPRARILDVALTLFDQRGYVGTSMDAIRKAAGFRTKSSLYTHFPSKESLSAALFQKILEEEAIALGPLMKPVDQASLEDVLNLAEQLAVWGLMHPAAYRFCFIQWHQDVPAAQAAGLEMLPRWASRVLERLQKEGSPIRAIDPEFLVNACQGLINQIIVSSPSQMSVAAIAEYARRTRVLCEAIVRT
ncbi:MAG: hypothetical protein C7B46_06090 [Sulfobacillus benefaciens]|uniref:HTH tetR-type domain-containing protein n=1 Tax=Sulfobacillus benefaciens TaxID=453960 RepID=A0A2T2XIH7_9FIRM|nr:MAG: hypothetical protein C7B46_06090 [Sulfobacillus benefaciens]